MKKGIIRLFVLLIVFPSLVWAQFDTDWLFEWEPEGPSKKKIEDMIFIKIKGGCFDMGDTFGDGESEEKPVHNVCVDDFYIGETEVTQAKWESIMGDNPSYNKGCNDCPVEQVSWNDIQEFINKLNQKTTPSIPLNKGGQRGMYSLPTEAEWEYAARSGGKKERYAGTSSESGLGDYAWYEANSGRQTHPVKQKRPNSLGLYDMSGNVWEWVYDLYDKGYYKNNPKDNPKGPSSGSYRVLRGGSWSDVPRNTRAAYRFRYNPTLRSYYGGFRLAASAQ